MALATCGIVISAGGLRALRLDLLWAKDPDKVEIERVQGSGETFDLSQLVKGEKIVITHLMRRHMWVEAWTYQLEGGDQPNLIVLKRESAWSKDHGLSAGNIISSQAESLSKADAVALGIFWKTVQSPVTTQRRFFDTYEVEYFRNEKSVGQESFVDFAPGRDTWGNSYEEILPERAAVLTEIQWKTARSFVQLVETANPDSR